MAAARNTRTAAPPTATPAMPPVLNPVLLLELTAAVVPAAGDDDDVDVGAISVIEIAVLVVLEGTADDEEPATPFAVRLT